MLQTENYKDDYIYTYLKWHENKQHESIFSSQGRELGMTILNISAETQTAMPSKSMIFFKKKKKKQSNSCEHFMLQFEPIITAETQNQWKTTALADS